MQPKDIGGYDNLDMLFQINSKPLLVHLLPAQEIKTNNLIKGIITICNTLGLNLYEEDTKEKVKESESELFIFEQVRKGIRATEYRVN